MCQPLITTRVPTCLVTTTTIDPHTLVLLLALQSLWRLASHTAHGSTRPTHDDQPYLAYRKATRDHTPETS